MSSTPLWTAEEIASATLGRWLVEPAPDWHPLKVSYDVRALSPGHLVVCKNPWSWGREAVDTAADLTRLAAAGAAGAIIQREQQHTYTSRPLPAGFPLLLVENTYRSLRHLAEAARGRFQGKVFAVTGTVGKTTTREMLRFVADRQGGAVANANNNNNIAGVFRTLAYTPRDLAASVLEMGFGKPIDGLGISSQVARPHVALITAIGRAHLAVFSPELLASKPATLLIAEHKARIFEGLTADGVAVVQRAVPHFEQIAELARSRASRLVTFGDDARAEHHLLDAQLTPQGSRVVARVGEEVLRYDLPIPGRHMVMNSLGVLTCVWAAGLDVRQAARDLGEFVGVRGRSRVFEIPVAGGGMALLIDDSFNATEASVGSCLELLRLFTPASGGRRIAVLGDVRNIGPCGVEAHRGFADLVLANDVDLVFTDGELMRHLHDALPPERRGSHTQSVAECYARLRASLRPGDVVAIKSGRGVGGLGDTEFLELGAALRAGRDHYRCDDPGFPTSSGRDRGGAISGIRSVAESETV